MYELQKLDLEWKVQGTLDVDAGAWDVRCEDVTYPDACSLPEPRSVLLAYRMEQMSAYTGTKSTVAHKQIPHYTKDALQSKNLSMLEKVNGTIEERNLQSFSKACMTYTSMTPALGK